MSEENEKKEAYVPPKASWRLPLFIKAQPKALKKKLVDCPTCPVFLLCQEGQGGTGYVCPICKSTGVWIDEPGLSALPKDILLIDCAKHNFDASKKLTKCALCSGGIMQLEWQNRGARNHYVATVHARVPIEARQAALAEAWTTWERHYLEEAKAAGKKKG